MLERIVGHYIEHWPQLFLEEGRFCSAEEAKKEGAKKPSEAVFQRSFGVRRPVSYVVTEKAPEKGDKAAWSRVVAVFVQGKEWQFRDWPFQVRPRGPAQRGLGLGFRVQF